MDRKEIFTELLKKYFEGSLTRDEVEDIILDEIPLDSFPKVELLTNCEEALRHINEPYFWTTDGELKYYLECLIGESIFSVDERDKRITESCKNTILTRIPFLYDLLKKYCDSTLTREEIAILVANGIPQDGYPTDPLQDNCEIALRRINDPDKSPTDTELKYYLECFNEQKLFSEKERDDRIKANNEKNSSIM